MTHLYSIPHIPPPYLTYRYIEGSGFQKKTDPLIPLPGSTTPRTHFPPVKLMFYRKLVLDRVKSVLKTFKEGLTDRALYVVYGFVYASSLIKDLRLFYKVSCCVWCMVYGVGCKRLVCVYMCMCVPVPLLPPYPPTYLTG
ncbi:hypothetical protein EON63_13695 [archaeon]|nr:MAG: hypothetical protein EON63_13695 [archaeon]